MEAKNLLSLIVTLGIGFGAGMIFAGHARNVSIQQEIDDAVRSAREECDARIQLAQQLSPKETAPATARKAPPGEIGSGGSGQDMVNRLIQRKGPLAPPSDSDPATAPPRINAEPPKVEMADSSSLKVLDIHNRLSYQNILVDGTIKNYSAGLCNSPEVTVKALDSRGLTVGTTSVIPRPADLDGFATATFEARFPASSGAVTFSAEVACH